MRCKYWIPEAAWRDRSVLHCRLQSIHKEIRSPHPWSLTPPGNWDPSCLWVIGGIARIVWSLPLISSSRFWRGCHQLHRCLNLWAYLPHLEWIVQYFLRSSHYSLDWITKQSARLSDLQSTVNQLRLLTDSVDFGQIRLNWMKHFELVVLF